MQTTKFKIIGIHCKSCKELIENEVDLLPGVKEISLDLKTYIAEINFDEKIISEYEIIKTIENLNYEVEEISRGVKNSIDKKSSDLKINSNIIVGGVLLIMIGLAYYVVSKLGAFELMGRLNESQIGYPLIFLIGLLASFHCVGMCGGIVMAYTTRYCSSKGNKKSFSWPHLSYNLGRLLSYTLVGMLLGGIGSFFAVNDLFIGLITLIAGLFMIAVGLSLITKHSILEKITGILPSSFARMFSNQLHTSRPRAPFVIGFLTGFMPCGPLQAMQIYSLASGSAINGGLSMAAYALGTVPLMFGFGNIISLFSQSRLRQVIKFSGIIVIILGLLTIYRSFGSFGSFGMENQNHINSKAESEGVVPKTSLNSNLNTTSNFNYQIAKMDLTNQGYSPSTLTVKKGIPVKWVINANKTTGCTKEILFPAFDIKKTIQSGENIIEFTPKAAGTYKFSCGMQMVWGKFIVTD